MSSSEKKDEKQILWVILASIGTAVLGSLCVVGPALFAAIGTAGVLGIIASGTGVLIPYGPLFWLISIAALVTAWIRIKRSSDCQPGWLLRCCRIGTVGVVLLAFLWVAAEAADAQTTYLKIEGLKSRACGKIVQQALADTPGVLGVELKRKFFSQTGMATVKYDPSTTRPAELILIIEQAGTALTPYKGEMVPGTN